MRWHLAAVLTVGVGAMACQSAPSLTQVEVRVVQDAIQTQLRSWERYLNNRHIDSALAMYHDNDRLDVGWTDATRTRGMADHEAQVNNFYNSIQFVNLGIQNPAVYVLSPTVASVSFRYSIDMQLNNTSRDPYSGLGMQVWTREDQAAPWKIQSHLMSRKN